MVSEHGKKKIAPAQVTDGGEGLNFSDASALAKKLHAEEQATGVSATVTETSGLDPETMTFGEAWDLYLKWASATKNPKALTTILSHHKATSGIHGMKIKGTPLKVLKGWAEQQLGLVCGSGKQKTSGSVGKNITQMKAALNHVAAEYDVDLTGGWQKWKSPASALAPVNKNPQGALTGNDLEKAVGAAYEVSTDVGHLIHLLALTGIRQGDLNKATVSCYKKVTGVLVLTEHKTAHKKGDMTIVLSSDAKALLNGMTAGKPPDAPLLGKVWSPFQLAGSVWKNVSSKAGIDPKVYSMNSIRHGFATSALYAGVPILSLAKAMGTSVAMIDSHYGHVLGELEAKAWEAHAPLKTGHLQVVAS